jgi:hypothetical protein
MLSQKTKGARVQGQGPGQGAQQIAALADDLPVVAGADAPLTALTAATAATAASAAIAAIEGLVGDLLFALADLSRRLGIDPEQALRSRALAFRDHIVALEGESARSR